MLRIIGRHSVRAVPVALGAVVLLAGCATVRPSSVTTADVVAASDRDRAAANVAPPIEGALSLHEAIARALKYNLDQRVNIAETMLATRQFDITKREMLPNVMASAGYTTRDTDLTRRSIDSVTGGLSNANPFISQERTHLVTELGVTWNLLDFGVGYYNAKQQANRILIADERRRKAVHTLIQDVQTAFWRAYSAQVLRQEILDTITLAEDALKDAQIAESERLRSPLDSLRFQRQILENLRTLEALDQELSTAKLDLARLINVPMGTQFALAEPSTNFTDEVLNVPVERLEELAITGNADLREQHYNARNAQLEARKAMMRMFPRLSFDYGFNYDSDKFLINNTWNDAGIQIAHNLLNIVNIPLQRKLSQAGIALADQRRIATLMTIISQVHISRQQYANARALYERANALSDVEQRILVQMTNREQAAVQSKLETVTSKTSLIISLLRRYQALAQVYAAESRLQATLGIDPSINKVDVLPLQDLASAVGTVFKDWRQGLAQAAAAQPTKNVQIAAVEAPQVQAPAAPPQEVATAAQESEVAAVLLSVSAPPAAAAKGPAVQIGVFSSEARAKAAAEALQARLADDRFEDVIQPVEVGAKMLYRVLLAGAGNRIEATALCNRVRASGGQCLIRS